MGFLQEWVGEGGGADQVTFQVCQLPLRLPSLDHDDAGVILIDPQDEGVVYRLRYVALHVGHARRIDLAEHFPQLVGPLAPVEGRAWGGQPVPATVGNGVEDGLDVDELSGALHMSISRSRPRGSA